MGNTPTTGEQVYSIDLSKDKQLSAGTYGTYYKIEKKKCFCCCCCKMKNN